MRQSVLIFCFCVLTITSCNSPRYLSTASKMIRTELYFGMAKSDGSVVSTMEWQSFVDQYITPNFKSGLSILDVSGQWMMETGELVRENSKLVILLHTRKEETLSAITDLVEHYKQIHGQEAVMRITTKSWVNF